RIVLAMVVTASLCSCGSSSDDQAATDQITIRAGTSSPASSSTIALSTTAPSTTPETGAPPSTALTDGAVPWADHPAQPNQRLVWARTLPTDQTEAPSCPLDALAISPSADGAMGTLYGALSVHNIGNTVCSVQGVPTIELVDDDGTVVQSTDPADSTNDAPAVVLVPNSWAQAALGVVGNNVCGGTGSTHMLLHWADATATLPFVVGRLVDSSGQCADDAIDSGSATELARPGHLQQPGTDRVAFAAMDEPQPSLATSFGLDQLTASLTLPDSVSAGSVLRYRVQLTHVTGENSVILADDACPIYRAAMGSASVEQLLNCTADGIVLPPGQSISFDMELEVPPGELPGTEVLTWTSTEPVGLSASAHITVT
ncbi:MAG: hypothetical protein JWN99_1418, partial [Ilumatobacteraceae bacterium]|nr:hypothetical protein [Ilumatobacteraceae bacterium]